MVRSARGLVTVLVTNPNPDLYGASRMAFESVAGLRDDGCRVVVSLPATGPLVGELRSVGAEVRFCPSPVLRKTYLSPTGLVRLAATTIGALPRMVGLLREVRPDVLYVNTVAEPVWLLLGRVLGIPVVCHVHEAESQTPRLVRRALTAPLLLARQVVANSQTTRALTAATWPRLAGRCAVLLNGVPGPPDRREPRARLDAPVRLLYVGRLSERKGVRDAVDALAILRDRGTRAELDVVGDVFPGYEPFEAELREAVCHLGLASDVRFHGFEPSVWSHLAQTDVLLVPSRGDESFGNAALEGILAARPVVASRAAGLVEATAGFRSAVTVDQGSPEQIADAVQEIVGRWPEYRTRALDDAGRAAERHAPHHYRSGAAALVRAVIDGGAVAADGG